MAYILDADLLIQAKNLHYGFDFCPAFWDWLDFERSRNSVQSIDRICNELMEGSDELADWASEREDSFFVPIDEATNTAMNQVSDWVQRSPCTESAKRDFFSKADPFLIAYSLAYGHTVVTRETFEANKTTKVKIPNVCRGLGVSYINEFEMLRTLNAKFILGHES